MGLEVDHEDVEEIEAGGDLVVIDPGARIPLEPIYTVFNKVVQQHSGVSLFPTYIDKVDLKQILKQGKATESKSDCYGNPLIPPLHHPPPIHQH